LNISFLGYRKPWQLNESKNAIASLVSSMLSSEVTGFLPVPGCGALLCTSPAPPPRDARWAVAIRPWHGHCDETSGLFLHKPWAFKPTDVWAGRMGQHGAHSLSTRSSRKSYACNNYCRSPPCFRDKDIDSTNNSQPWNSNN
jgi:hypothetical protein